MCRTDCASPDSWHLTERHSGLSRATMVAPRLFELPFGCRSGSTDAKLRKIAQHRVGTSHLRTHSFLCGRAELHGLSRIVTVTKHKGGNPVFSTTQLRANAAKALECAADFRRQAQATERTIQRSMAAIARLNRMTYPPRDETAARNE